MLWVAATHNNESKEHETRGHHELDERDPELDLCEQIGSPDVESQEDGQGDSCEDTGVELDPK